jgi:hypothetical protein
MAEFMNKMKKEDLYSTISPDGCHIVLTIISVYVTGKKMA